LFGGFELQKMHVVLDIFGSTESVLITSNSRNTLTPTPVEPVATMNSAYAPSTSDIKFHEKHGQNIELLDGSSRAKRVSGYGYGILISSQHVTRGQIFQVWTIQNVVWK